MVATILMGASEAARTGSDATTISIGSTEVYYHVNDRTHTLKAYVLHDRHQFRTLNNVLQYN